MTGILLKLIVAPTERNGSDRMEMRWLLQESELSGKELVSSSLLFLPTVSGFLEQAVRRL